MLKSAIKDLLRLIGYCVIDTRHFAQLQEYQHIASEAGAALADTRAQLAQTQSALDAASAERDEYKTARAEADGYKLAYETVCTQLSDAQVLLARFQPLGDLGIKLDAYETARAEADGYKLAYETVCSQLSAAQVLLARFEPHGDVVKEALRTFSPPTRRLKDTPGLVEEVKAEATRLGLPEPVTRLISAPDFSVEDRDSYRGLFAVARPPVWYRVGEVVAKIIDRQYIQYRPRSLPADHARAVQVADTLRREGFVQLDPLFTPEQLQDMMAHFLRSGVYNGHTPDSARHPGLGRYVNYTAEDFPLGSYSTASIANAPHVLEAALSPFILDAAAAYLGCTPQLSWLQAWWNFEGAGDYPHRQHLYHPDQNDFRMFWVYVYLSDVTPDSGPHRLIRRSADFDLIRKLCPAAADDPPDGSDFGVPSGSGSHREVEDMFGDLLQEVTGPAGTTFVSRGIDLHRVVTPLVRKRLILALRFTMIDFPDVGPGRDGDPIPGHIVAERVGDDEHIRHVTKLRFDWSPRPSR